MPKEPTLKTYVGTVSILARSKREAEKNFRGAFKHVILEEGNDILAILDKGLLKPKTGVKK